MQGFFVTGTDTDVGKTLVSAWLMTHLDACYWKPVQAGALPETDSETVRRLAEVPQDRILPEAYLLPEAMAPHEAARHAGIRIDMAKLVPPHSERPLVMRSTVRPSTALASLKGSNKALKSGLCFNRLKVHTTSCAESVRPL